MISERIDSKFPLRMTPSERATVEGVQAEAAAAGIKDVSLNDVIRHLIRRATTPGPLNEFQARLAISDHWVSCEVCERTDTPEALVPKCLDGLSVQRNYLQFTRVTQNA